LRKRVLERVSPSQVSTFEMCARKWVLSSVYGLRQPSTSAQELGTAIHAEVEHYFETGEIRKSPYEKLVRALIEHMPARSPEVEIEEWIEVPTYEGGPVMRGRGDVLKASPDLPHVFDAKTTSDVRRYGKKEHELADHGQLNVYGQAVLNRFPQAEKVGLTLVHVQTRGRPHTHAPTIYATREEVRTRYEKTLKRVRLMMKWIAQGVPAYLEVSPDTSSCSAYGGCEYQGVCGEGGRLSLIKLRRGTLHRKIQEAGGKIPETNKPEIQLPTRKDVNMGKTLDELMAERSAQKGGSSAAPKPPIAKPPIAKPFEEEVPQAMLHKVKCVTCKGSRYMAKPNGGVGAFVSCTACNGSGFESSTPAAATVEPVLSPDAPPTDAIKAAPVAEEKPKKTRAKKEAAPTSTQTASVTVPVTVPASVTSNPQVFFKGEKIEGISAELRTLTSASSTQRVLYVDAMPTKGPDVADAVHFEDWVRPLMDETAARLNKADYRLQEYTAEAELALTIRKAIDAGRLPRVVLVNSHAKARAVFLEQAIPVPRGVRPDRDGSADRLGRLGPSTILGIDCLHAKPGSRVR
jgi:hypothetical protein